MTVTRFVLLARDREPRQADLELIRLTPDVVVLDTTADRALLVEGSLEAVEALAAHLPGWTVAPAATHPRPSPVQYRPRPPDER